MRIVKKFRFFFQKKNKIRPKPDTGTTPKHSEEPNLKRKLQTGELGDAKRRKIATQNCEQIDVPRITSSQEKSSNLCMNISLETNVTSTSKSNNELTDVPHENDVIMKFLSVNKFPFV